MYFCLLAVLLLWTRTEVSLLSSRSSFPCAMDAVAMALVSSPAILSLEMAPTTGALTAVVMSAGQVNNSFLEEVLYKFLVD